MTNRASIWKKVSLIVSGVAVLCVIGVGALPWVVSTSWGKNALIHFLEKKGHISLQIEEIRLSWLGTQQIKNVAFTSLDTALAAGCEQISSDASLISILFDHHYFGDVLIQKPHVKIAKDLLTHTDVTVPAIQKAGFALPLPLDRALTNLFFPITGNFLAAEGTIEVASKGLEPIVFQSINATVFLPKDRAQLSANLVATSTQKNQQGKIFLEAIVKDVHAENIAVSAKLSLSQFPMRALDQIVAAFDPTLSGILLEGIGPNLDMQIDGHYHKDRLQAQLSASAQNMKAKLSATTQGDCILLTEPASLSLTCTSKLSTLLFERLLSRKELCLANNTTFSLTVDQFSLPFTKEKIDFANLQMHAGVTSTPLTIQMISAPPLTLSPLQATLSCDRLQEECTLSLTGSVSSNKSALNSFSASATIQSPLNEKRETQISLDMQSLPTDLLDSFNPSAIRLRDILGANVSAKVSSSVQQNKNSICLSLHSPLLSLPSTSFTLDDTLSLQGEVALEYTISPSLLSALGLEKEVSLTQNEKMRLTITELVLPLDGSDKIKATGTMQLGNLRFEKLFTLSNFSLDNLSMVFVADTLHKLKVDVQSSQLSALAELDIGKDTLSLKKPLSFDVSLTDELIASLLSSPARPHLTAPSTLQMEIDPMTISLSGKALLQNALKGKLSIPTLTLQNSDASVCTTVNRCLAAFTFDGKKPLLQLKMAANLQTAAATEPGTVALDLSLENFLQNATFSSELMKLSSTIALHAIPLASVESIFSKENRLQKILGSTVDAKVQVQYDPKQKNISLEATSALLFLKGTVGWTDAFVSVQSPFEIHFTVTPESYPLFDKLITGQNPIERPFSLKEKTTFNISVSKFQVPVKKTTCSDGSSSTSLCLLADPSAVEIAAKLDNTDLSFQENGTGQVVTLKNMAASVDKTGSSALSVQLHSQTSSSQGNNKASRSDGSISLEGAFSSYLNKQNELDLSLMQSKVKLSMQKLPTLSLDLFCRALGKTDFPFSTIFGTDLNATISVDLQKASGPISMNINSPNTRASMAGKLTEGVLTLSEPIYAQVTMTEELSSFFLKEVNPLSISSITSKHPITIEIDQQGFSMPVIPFSLSATKLPHARMELGQIYCKNEGNINIALGLLKLRQLSKQDALELWFAPIDFSLSQGILDVERTEILIASTYDVALWGKINFPKDQVNMILGLTAQCLRQAFGIKNLPDDYVMHIPMKGKLNNVQINSTKATAKIAALLAWQQKSLAGSLGGGAAGAVLGELLNKVGALPVNDESTPPAKKPLPWDGPSSDKKKTSQKEGKKTHLSGREKPMRQLWKIMK